MCRSNSKKKIWKTSPLSEGFITTRSMHICFHSPKFTRLRKQKAKERQAPVFHLHIESIVVGTSLIVHFSNTRIMLDVGTWILLSHTRQHKDVRKIQPVLWENPAGMSSILFTIGHLVT